MPSNYNPLTFASSCSKYETTITPEKEGAVQRISYDNPRELTASLTIDSNLELFFMNFTWVPKDKPKELVTLKLLTDKDKTNDLFISATQGEKSWTEIFPNRIDTVHFLKAHTSEVNTSLARAKENHRLPDLSTHCKELLERYKAMVQSAFHGPEKDRGHYIMAMINYDLMAHEAAFIKKNAKRQGLLQPSEFDVYWILTTQRARISDSVIRD